MMHTTYFHSVTHTRTFGHHFCIFKFQKKNFYLCLLYILCFAKDLENQEAPGWPWDFRPYVTGFVLGFGFVPVSQNLNFLGLFRYPFWSCLELAGFFLQSCDKMASWNLGYQTFLEENADIFKLLLLISLYLA